MYELSAYVVEQNDDGMVHGRPDQQNIAKLDLCEGGSYSTAIFNSDIQLSVYSCSCFISVCRFVKGNVCGKFAHCFVLSALKSINF